MFRVAWMGALAAGVVLAVLFVVVPAGLPKDLVWQALVAGAAVAVAVGVRRHRPDNPGPWWLAAIGVAVFAVGSLITAAVWDLPAESPIRAAVAIAFVGAYLCIGAASARFVRAMVPEGDREGFLDGAIVMVAVAIGLWGVLFEGAEVTAATSWAIQLENVASCLVPAWVMAMCVRVIFVAGHRQPSAVLLFLGGATALAGNVVSLLLEQRGGYGPGHPADVLWFAAFATLAASALHPSMRHMTVPSPRRDALPLARVTALALSLLVVPVALRVAADLPTSSIPFLGALILSSLVCWRFIQLVVELGRSRQELRWVADRQAALSELSEAALSGQPLESLTHRALDLLWRHLPRHEGVGDEAAAAHPRLALPGAASESLRAALPRRTLDAGEESYVHAIANILDVAAIREETETAMRHRAVHDQLTGLPNRVLLEDRLVTALARAEREGTRVAVLFIDLDGFKAVNDSIGHDAGDDMLMEVATRLHAAVRPQDALVRFAGDEFVIVIEEADLDVAWSVGERVLERLAPPVFLQEGNAVTPAASIGIAFAGPEPVEPDELIRQADAAMYRAKQRGGTRCEIFDEELRAELSHRHLLERGLRGAADRGELTLVYQPIVRLGGGGGDLDVVVGAEALLRWHHPVHGQVPPAEFIPLAEAGGLIASIGDWVLATAIEQLASWQAGTNPGPDLTLYVNLSPVQLADPRLYDRVQALLAESGADPSGLGIEITESAVLDVGDASIAMVLALKSLGISVALDDFGTGYSSLTHVRSVPFDLLKVDASFVDKIGSERGDRAIVAAVAGLARELGVDVLAEGVEDAGQLAAVRELGCDLAQGYLLARPLPPAELGATFPGARAARRTGLPAARVRPRR